MKRILVTGANRGLGLEFVRQLAQRGDRVWAACRKPDDAADLLALAAEYEGRVRPVAMDVAAEESIAAARAAMAGVEALDWVINNAGCFAEAEEGLSRVEGPKMLRVFAVNSVGPVLVTKHFRDLLVCGNDPKMAALISGVGVLSRREWPPGSQFSYGMSKAALHLAVQILAGDLRPDGVAAFGMGPGFVLTDMTKGSPTPPPLRPPESVNGMLTTLERLTMADSGHFFDYSGTEARWF